MTRHVLVSLSTKLDYQQQIQPHNTNCTLSMDSFGLHANNFRDYGSSLLQNNDIMSASTCKQFGLIHCIFGM